MMEVAYERLYAMEPCLQLKRFPPKLVSNQGPLDH